MPAWVMQFGMPIIVLVFGLIVLCIVIKGKTAGWGTQSIRMAGLVLVVTVILFLVAVSISLPSMPQESITAAFGILGTVAGYLFGKTAKED